MPQPNQPASPHSSASARERKATLRTRFRQARRDIASPERAAMSARIAAHILAWLDDLDSPPRTMALYLASATEANLDALIEPLRARGIRIAAPCGHGFALVEAASTCAMGQGWREADGSEVRVEEIDLALLPGLAFGRDGSRLGQGGAWFDRVLSDSRAVLVGVGFGCQIVDALPVEAHDVAVGWIACEQGVALRGVS